jgi:hypothetical protein
MSDSLSGNFLNKILVFAFVAWTTSTVLTIFIATLVIILCIVLLTSILAIFLTNVFNLLRNNYAHGKNNNCLFLSFIMIWKKAIIPRPSAIELIKHKTANNNEENNLESVPNAESPSALADYEVLRTNSISVKLICQQISETEIMFVTSAFRSLNCNINEILHLRKWMFILDFHLTVHQR